VPLPPGGMRTMSAAIRTTGVGAWRDDDLLAYLSTGHALGHGTAAGPMGEAVDESLSRLAPDDVKALVTYLRSVPATAERVLRHRSLDQRPSRIKRA